MARTLKPQATRVYVQRFTVTGGGEFPLDMLRYDCAWPHSSADVAAIESVGKRSVVLDRVSWNGHGPEAGRWESFNWKVANIDNR